MCFVVYIITNSGTFVNAFCWKIHIFSKQFFGCSLNRLFHFKRQSTIHWSGLLTPYVYFCLSSVDCCLNCLFEFQEAVHSVLVSANIAFLYGNARHLITIAQCGKEAPFWLLRALHKGVRIDHVVEIARALSFQGDLAPRLSGGRV